MSVPPCHLTQLASRAIAAATALTPPLPKPKQQNQPLPDTLPEDDDSDNIALKATATKLPVASTEYEQSVWYHTVMQSINTLHQLWHRASADDAQSTTVSYDYDTKQSTATYGMYSAYLLL